jgi:2-phosphosulfolactate phosphatase
MYSVDVCLTPELLHLYPVEGKTVVVVDILRATSVMTTAIAHGIKEIIPVKTIAECRELKEAGCLAAAERNGEMQEGFDFGNSPFSYMVDEIKGKTLAITTTNGTVAIKNSEEAKEIIIGSFLNISTVKNYLLENQNNILILCAGWKGRVNLEDTLFAGALIEMLKDDFELNHDGVLIAHSIFVNAGDDKLKFLNGCSHFKRLAKLNIQKDIEFCLEHDVYDVLPIVVDGVIKDVRELVAVR